MKLLHSFFATSTLLPALTLRVAAQAPYPFQNPKLPVEQRIDSIISLLTLEEKISMN